MSRGTYFIGLLKYEVSIENLWFWLEELEDCGYITELNQRAKDAALKDLVGALNTM
ncbi:MAG: hypothetical protein QXH67_00810 [Candidatus Bathyarchaeia archaeon]